MAPYVFTLGFRSVSGGQELSHLKKRGEEYETWQIVLMVLFPSLLALSLAAYCLHQRARLHRLYQETKKTNPLLKEKDFAKMSKLSLAKRLDQEEQERAIMISKSLASRTSLVSSSMSNYSAPRRNLSPSVMRPLRGNEPLTIKTSGPGSTPSLSPREFSPVEQLQHSIPGSIHDLEHWERPQTAQTLGSSIPPSPLSQVMFNPLAAEPEPSPPPPNQVTSPRMGPRDVSALPSRADSPLPASPLSAKSKSSRRASLPARPSIIYSSPSRPPSCAL